MNSCAIDGTSHNAIESIDLPDQMSFAEPADRRVAGHHTDAIPAMGDQSDTCAKASGSRGGLGAGMASTNNHDIK